MHPTRKGQGIGSLQADYLVDAITFWWRATLHVTTLLRGTRLSWQAGARNRNWTLRDRRPSNFKKTSVPASGTEIGNYILLIFLFFMLNTTLDYNTTPNSYIK